MSKAHQPVAQEIVAGRLGEHWQALRTEPTNSHAWHVLAVTYAARGWVWHASYADTQALRCAQAQNLAVEPVVAIEPQAPWGSPDAQLLARPQAWAGLSLVQAELQQHVRQEPADWLSWLYLARCMDMSAEAVRPTQDAQDALHEAVRRALDCEPIAGETGHMLAQWRLRAGQPAAALAALRAVLLQAPRRHSSWLLQAQALMQLGQEPEARYAFEQAGQSRNPELLSLLAEKLFQFNFGYEALTVLRAVTMLRPDSAQAWQRLANIQSRLWQSDEAQVSIARAQALEPDNLALRRDAEDLQAIAHSQPQFDRELARFEASGLGTNAQGAQRLLMQSLYQDHLSAQQIAELHRCVGAAMQAQAFVLDRDLERPKPAPWPGPRRLRVGYVSGDLHRQHPVNVFMLPVLMRHDHAAVEVFIYQTGTLIDEYTRKAQACADHWREAAHLSDVALRETIVQDRIDVLIDLAGHTASHRLGVFAMRSAPVQMSYLGYPHSTGLACIDWMVVDDVVAPFEHAPLFTEQLARVSGSVFCWSPVEDYPLPPDSTRVRQGPVVFASFNNLLKVSDSTLAAWARVLRQCPDSKLLLKSAVLADPAVRRQTLARCNAQGIDAGRLDLQGPSELSQMMQAYLDVDVVLDPFPYNGGTTSLQALWMGCPMVALEGHNFVSRMGASFLSHLGRPEWLARDVDSYVAKAVELAQQVRQMPWNRQAQRRAMQASDLCQIDRHTRELEAIYVRAFEDWQSSPDLT